MADIREREIGSVGGRDGEAAGKAQFADAERASKVPAQSSERRYRFLAKTIPQIVWTASPKGLIDSFNPRWSEYTGQSSRPNPDRSWQETLHLEDVRRWIEGWERSRSSGMKLALDLRLRRVDGIYRWHLVHALPVRDRSGRLLKWMGTCTDIDDQKRAEGMLRFQAEVSTVLASSLDYETTLATVARMAVPHVADWCVVDMLEAGGSMRRLAAAHADPSKVDLAWELARRYAPALGDPRVAVRVLQTGRSEIGAEVDDAVLVASARDAEHLAMLRAQGCISSISAALAARGRTLGVITFAMAESGRRYSPADLPLVEDLARRAAMAVDNARLYGEARQAREEAEAANRAKDRFLAVLSHELRTPLTPVLADVSAMLDDPSTSNEFRPFLEMTRRNVELEARLIDDLLDLNRIVQGKLRLNREVIDAHGLILQALEICRPGIAESALKVEIALKATRPHVDADAARLQQVIWNLLKNAVKFTPGGGSIAIRTRDDFGRLRIEVADTGVGIDPEVLPRIFDAFEQGNKLGHPAVRRAGPGPGDQPEPGQGPRRTAHRRQPGQGTRLDFHAGVARGRRTDRAPVAGPPAAEATNPKGPLRILLVEDNIDSLRVMARLLGRRGHHVATAECVEAALRVMDEQEEFDLLISDLGLPDGTGLDLMRRLKLTGGPPGIALSGFGMDDDLRRSREVGFVEHLTKPVDFAKLEAAIGRIASKSRTARP